MSSAKYGKKTGTELSTVPLISKRTVVSDPRCKICQSPYRNEIDFCLASGWSNAKTMQRFNYLMGQEYFNASNFSTHNRKHLMIRDEAIREILEESAKQLGMDLDSVKGLITTRRGAVEAVIQQALSNMVRGTSHVEIKDMLQAIQILEKMEQDYAGASVAELERELRIFMEAVKKIVPNAMWRDIADEYYKGVERHSMMELPAAAAVEIEEGVVDGHTA